MPECYNKKKKKQKQKTDSLALKIQKQSLLLLVLVLLYIQFNPTQYNCIHKTVIIENLKGTMETGYFCLCLDFLNEGNYDILNLRTTYSK